MYKVKISGACKSLMTAILVLMVMLTCLQAVRAATWQNEMELSTDKGSEAQNLPAIAAENDKVYVVWADITNYDLYFKEHDGASWQPDLIISNQSMPGSSNIPSMDVENGKIYVVWQGPWAGSIDPELLFRYYDGLTWQPIEEIANDVGWELQSRSSIAVENGKVYVAWEDLRDGDWDIYFRMHDGLSWGPVQDISGDAGSDAQIEPSIAVENGTVYAVWYNQTGPNSEVWFRLFNGTAWEPIQEISTGGANHLMPSIDVENGKIHVVWIDEKGGDRDVYYRYFNGTGWEPEQDISDDDASESQESPKIVVENDKIYCVWQHSKVGGGDWNVGYRHYNGTGWEPKQFVQQDPGTDFQWDPAIAVDNGIVHVVWEDNRGGDTDIFYRRGVEIPQETIPPMIDNLLLDDGSTKASTLVVEKGQVEVVYLNATIDDNLTGNSRVAFANYTVGQEAWSMSVNMNPADGLFNSSTEDVYVVIDISDWSVGTYDLWVYAGDVKGNLNTTGQNVTLILMDTRAPRISDVNLSDGISQENMLTVEYGVVTSIYLNATLDDSNTGNSNISYANYTIGEGIWASKVDMDPSDGLFNSSLENVNMTINISSWSPGSYDLWVYGSDIMGNRNITGLNGTLIIQDSNIPNASADISGSYWKNSYTFDIQWTASDNFGLSNITLLYRFSTDNSFWDSWTEYSHNNSVSGTSASGSFNFIASTEGYYEFFANASDIDGNWEPDAPSAEAIAAVDTAAPTSNLNAISPYWRMTTPLTLGASASDSFSDVAEVALYYRYSQDNLTWTSWAVFGTDYSSPWEWSFYFWDGDGYYEFYSLSKDHAGNIESKTLKDVLCGFDATSPIADAGEDQETEPDKIVNFDGSGSNDNLGFIANYTWTITEQTTTVAVLYGSNPTYSFDENGDFLITLTVRDMAGNTDGDTIEVSVTSDLEAPVIAHSPIPPVQEVGGTVNITAVVTDNTGVYGVWVNIFDEENNALGNFSMTRMTNSYWYESIYLDLGTFSYTLWANDTSGNWNSAYGSFLIQDTTPPIADAGEGLTINISDMLNFDGSGSSDNVGIVNYTWNITKNGTLAATLYGVYPSYIPDELGSYEAILTVRDASGNIAADSITVTVVSPQTDGAPIDDSNGPDYWWLIILIIIIIVVMLLIFLIFKRRKKEPEEKPPDETPSPPEIE